MTAATSTVEALMFSLRERGVAALAERPVKLRLRELDDEQMIAVARRLQHLKPHIAPAWSDDDIAALFVAKENSQ